MLPSNSGSCGFCMCVLTFLIEINKIIPFDVLNYRNNIMSFTGKNDFKILSKEYY